MAETKVGRDSMALFGLALLLIGLALAIDSGPVAWLLGPIALLLIIVVMTKVPLRVSLFALMLCALVLENPAEVPADGRWKSPLYPVGALLLNHLNTTIDLKLLVMSGMDIMLATLGLIAFSRRASNSKLERGHVAVPKPMVQLALVSLGGTAFVWISGMIRGGDFSMSLWQIDRVVYLPLVFLLFNAGLRGPADHVALGRVLIVAAVIRATAATIIIHTVYLAPDDNGIIAILPYATSHHDSVLFADGFVLLLALLLSRVGKKRLRFVWLAAPILIAGMISNHRRMVWVQVALSFGVLYLITPTNSVKRRLQRALLWASPFLATYAAAGWNSESGIFKPVKILRSVVDATSDSSTMWREIENFDLISTIKDNPLFGTGYGHGYQEVVMLPPIDYSLERYVPHNSILGLWSYCGYFGFAAITTLWVAGVYFAVRAYHAAQQPIDRAAALACVGAILAYLVQCWGDLGLGSWTGVFTVAAALATSGKLAVATGGWERKKAKTAGNGPRYPAGVGSPDPGQTAAQR